MHAQRAEGQRLARPGVDEEHLAVQNQVLAGGEGVGDELLEVAHLLTQSQRFNVKVTSQKIKSVNDIHCDFLRTSMA